ncbi:hypothetical protein F3Y22_tig00110328pilonHSYRG01186 [Hibiscus syriacus]|uniref:Moybdenum cofactor oxidoreductase dimerisation domain-containing protein n=1 Tax=Hibiscus syriacus TaxID=106335 RepID=A0A6A3B344_HIBSY|nr:hypothetical protein F3Y22_tig00110328pilonHSYRG01186 [Hibiscus syriacus]
MMMQLLYYLAIMPKPLNRDHGFPLKSNCARSYRCSFCQVAGFYQYNSRRMPGLFHAKGLQDVPTIRGLGIFNTFTSKFSNNLNNYEDYDLTHTEIPRSFFYILSVICSLEDVQSIKPGKVTIAGYAVARGGRGIERVDVSIDGGKT